MQQLSFLFPTAEEMQDILVEEYSVMDGNLKVIQSYFAGCSKDPDNEEVVWTFGYTMYEYYDSDIDEYTYMVIGWKMIDCLVEIDDFPVGDGFEMIDDADEYLCENHGPVFKV